MKPSADWEEGQSSSEVVVAEIIAFGARHGSNIFSSSFSKVSSPVPRLHKAGAADAQGSRLDVRAFIRKRQAILVAFVLCWLGASAQLLTEINAHFQVRRYGRSTCSPCLGTTRRPQSSRRGGRSLLSLTSCALRWRRACTWAPRQLRETGIACTLPALRTSSTVSGCCARPASRTT